MSFNILSCLKIKFYNEKLEKVFMEMKTSTSKHTCVRLCMCITYTYHVLFFLIFFLLPDCQVDLKTKSKTYSRTYIHTHEYIWWKEQKSNKKSHNFQLALKGFFLLLWNFYFIRQTRWHLVYRMKYNLKLVKPTA